MHSNLVQETLTKQKALCRNCSVHARHNVQRLCTQITPFPHIEITIVAQKEYYEDVGVAFV